MNRTGLGLPVPVLLLVPLVPLEEPLLLATMLAPPRPLTKLASVLL